MRPWLEVRHSKDGSETDEQWSSLNSCPRWITWRASARRTVFPSLRIRIEPGDVLVVPLPVLEISARLIRKKAERVAKLDWNPALGTLESPWCESCFGRAHPLFYATSVCTSFANPA